MENGSGGHLTSLSFTGGKIGIWTGNQQFTFQDCSFKACHIAISVHWNWTMLFSRIDVQHCFIGFMMRVDQDAAAASVTCMDWKVQEVGFAFLIIGSNESAKGSLVLSNVETRKAGRILTRILADDYSDQKQFGQLLSPLRHSDDWTTTNWTWQGDVPSKNESVPRTGQLELKRPKAFSSAQGNCFYRLRPDCESERDDRQGTLDLLRLTSEIRLSPSSRSRCATVQVCQRQGPRSNWRWSTRRYRRPAEGSGQFQ